MVPADQGIEVNMMHRIDEILKENHITLVI